MELVRPEQIVAAAVIRPTPLDKQIMENMNRPSALNFHICHFVSVRHFKTLMTTSVLSLCRCDRFKDVGDGLLPAPNKASESPTMTRIYDDLGKNTINAQGRKVHFKRDPDREYRQQEIARTLSYVHCWFTGDSTDDSMWREYGQDGTGVCIESSSHDLLRSISRPPNVDQITYGLVTYSDGSRPIATAISYVPFLHKHARFIKEQEIRIVAQLAHDPVTLRYDNTSERLSVPIVLPILIHRIVLGKEIDRDTEIEMTGLVAGFAGNVPIVRQTK